MTFDFSQSSYLALKKTLEERTSPVVAWVGAGMSAPAGLPSWEKLLNDLIALVKRKSSLLEPDDKRLSLETALYEEQKKKNYWLCFQLIEKLLGETTYQAEIRERLDTSSHSKIPEGYSLLWKAKIQGIISLNLDQFSTRAFSQEFSGEPLDSFIGDQSKNLAAVLQRNRAFVGNVHGVVDNSSTWIFTHDKLNNLLSDPGYQSFISGCLLSRTIFFVGISADDIAIQAHFDRIKKSGISGIVHYWLTSRNDASTNEWSERFNIRQIIYSAPENDHSEAIECLRDLATTASPKELIIQTPVTLSQFSGKSKDPLLPPDDLVIRPLKEIRISLNSHALNILANADEDSYKNYEKFSLDYDEAIDRAWYVTSAPPKNNLLGYTLNERISQGSFGDVYNATTVDGKTVALKLLRRDVRRTPAMLQAFRRGVRSMRILKNHSSKGMVEFLDASEIPAFVAMEWINGPNLIDAVESRILSDWLSILRVARDLARIIYAAHTLPEGVLHRDIRPPNVMLKDYWSNGNELEVVVMDFDLSWHIDSLEQSIVTKPLGFMAPEQLHKRPKESTRSALVDSFGIGMTIFYMLTGDIPVPDQQKHKDWERNLHNKIRSKNCKDWKSVSHRALRLIHGSTQDEQRYRWDFAKIVSELEFLHLAAEGTHQNLPIDYHAEEVAAHAETMLNYIWDDTRLTAVYKSGGLVIEISGNAPDDEIQLSIEWSQTGEENWKLLPKTGAQVKERAHPLLEKHGWHGTKFDASLRYFRVNATTKTRTNFNPKNLAKGVDSLAQIMMPKN